MWLYFLRHADELNEVPIKMSTVDEVNKAFEAARRVNLKALELEEIEKREKYAMSEVENLAWARDLAEAEGLAKGIEQGMEQGIVQGIEQGLEQGRSEGVELGRVQAILDILDARHGSLPTNLKGQLLSLQDQEKLQEATVLAATLPTLEEFQNWVDQEDHV